MLYEVITPPGDSPPPAARALHGVPIWRPWLDEASYPMSGRVDSAFLREANDTLDTMVLVSPLPFAGGCAIAVFADDPPVPGSSGAGGSRITSYNVCYTKLLRPFAAS